MPNAGLKKILKQGLCNFFNHSKMRVMNVSIFSADLCHDDAIPLYGSFCRKVHVYSLKLLKTVVTSKHCWCNSKSMALGNDECVKEVKNPKLASRPRRASN